MGLENISMPNKGEHTPDNVAPISVDNSHILQVAEYHWNMAKQMGISCVNEYQSFIDIITDMEIRDRKEAEKLGNRNVSREHLHI